MAVVSEPGETPACSRRATKAWNETRADEDEEDDADDDDDLSRRSRMAAPRMGRSVQTRC